MIIVRILLYRLIMTKKIIFGSYVKMDVNEIRDNYNTRNSCVDKANQNISYYNCQRNSLK